MTKEWLAAPDLKEHFGPNTDRVELTLQLGTVSEPVTEQGSESSVKSSVSEKFSENSSGDA